MKGVNWESFGYEGRLRMIQWVEWWWRLGREKEGERRDLAGFGIGIDSRCGRNGLKGMERNIDEI